MLHLVVLSSISTKHRIYQFFSSYLLHDYSIRQVMMMCIIQSVIYSLSVIIPIGTAQMIVGVNGPLKGHTYIGVASL